MLTLRPGVNQTSTPALNEAGYSTSNLIRFFYDPIQGGLAQKLGGWTRFYPTPMAGIVRALWGWEDTNAVTHLAVATENIPATTTAELSVITNGSRAVITPTYAITNNITPSVSTTTGSPVVTIVDTTTTGITSYDTVYIQTHISVGGLVLYGLYPCIQLSSNSYKITALTILGEPNPATATTSSAALPLFSTTTGSAVVQVTLADHGYNVGDTFPVLIPTTVGGITFNSDYIVRTVTDPDNFLIIASSVASGTTTGYLNGGNVQFIYSYGMGPAQAGSGYGIGGYGRGGYGTGESITPSSGVAISAENWTLGNWGEVLIACPDNDINVGQGALFEPIYAFDPTSGFPMATVIPQAPAVNEGVFIAMPQRQIVAYGSSLTGVQDPLLINWCDVNNFNQWIALVTNEAGSFRIPRGSRVVGGIQGPQQAIIWTDIGVWQMQYIGPPLVYSFTEVGFGCGLIAKQAAGALNGVVYWMGPKQFYSLSGAGVQSLACPVWDVIFQNLDEANTDNIRCAINSMFDEVTWYYPTLTSGGEVAAYVKYNASLQQWDYGQLARSAWIDQSVLGPPIGADPVSGYIYQHETSTDADGQPLCASFQTGYFALADGDVKTFVDQVWPDFKWGYNQGVQNATLSITFYVADYPGQTPAVFGPFTVTQSSTYFRPRFRGRLVSIGIQSNDVGSWWRLGGIRYELMPDGRY